MTSLRAKALAVLRSGRLTSLNARYAGGANLSAEQVLARVQSSRQGGPAYAVDYLDGVWTCTCRQGGGCAHVAAAQLVTGHAPADLLGAVA